MLDRNKARIYAIRHNGKIIYVGQTRVTVDSRFFEHMRRAISGRTEVPKLFDYIRKHNAENFTFEMLEMVDNDRRFEREQHWVEFHDTKNNGCNTTKGGATGVGKDHYRYGKKGMTEAQKASAALRKGKKLSLEHRMAISKGNRGIPRPTLCKAVICTENNTVYPSIREAAKILGLNEKHISRHLFSGKNAKPVGGYTFKRHGDL